MLCKVVLEKVLHLDPHVAAIEVFLQTTNSMTTQFCQASPLLLAPSNIYHRALLSKVGGLPPSSKSVSLFIEHPVTHNMHTSGRVNALRKKFSMTIS